jgi:hypothetical protein
VRLFIHNEADTRIEENADAGFEVEVVSAREYDEIVDELVRVQAALSCCVKVLERRDTMANKAWRAARTEAIAAAKKCNPWRGT